MLAFQIQDQFLARKLDDSSQRGISNCNSICSRFKLAWKVSKLKIKKLHIKIVAYVVDRKIKFC